MLPPWLSWPSPEGFLGRSAELEVLEQAATEARDGRGQAVLIGGEPGVGKTALVARFAAGLAEAGTVVLAGRCNVDPLLPYEPLVEALRQRLAGLPPAELTNRLGILSPEVARLLPELARLAAVQPRTEPRSSPTGDVSDLQRHHLFDSVARLLIGPDLLLLVLDNLHWADLPTMRLVTYLLQRAAASGLLVVGTYRDTEVGPTHPLTLLSSEGNVRRLSLTGLDPDETAALVSASHRVTDPDGSIGAVLHHRTGGNPLYVNELLLALDGLEGSLAIEAAASQLPEDLRLLIALRLGQLSQTTKMALSAAAVVGDDFDLATLELVRDAGGDSDELLDALDEAVTVGVVSEIPRMGIGYRFTHDLFRQALYEDVPPLRRARLHRQVGLALEGSEVSDPYRRVGALAHHFIEAAVLGDIDKAVEYCLRAARQANSQQAFGRSIGLIERMLALVPVGPDWLEIRSELLIELSRALFFGGELPRSLTVAFEAADRARDAASALLLARATVVAVRAATSGVRVPAAEALYDEALEAVGGSGASPEADCLRAELLAHFSWYHDITLNDAVAGQRLAEEAVALAERSGDRSVLGHALYALAASSLCTPDAERTLDLADRIESIAHDLNDMDLYSRGLRAHAAGRLHVGDTAGFAADCTRLQAVYSQLQVWLDGAELAMWEGTLALLHGKFDDVQGTIAAVIDRGGHEQNYRNSAAAQTLALHRERGEAGALLPLASEVADANPSIPTFRAAVALLHVELGQLEEARAHFESLAGNDFADIPIDFVWTIALALLVEVAVSLGDEARARCLFEMLVPFHGLTVMGRGVYCIGTVDRYLGMLASTMSDNDGAERFFAAADRLEESMDALPLRCRTRLWWARHRLAHDPISARAMAAEFVAEAEGLGMPLLASSLREVAGRP